MYSYRYGIGSLSCHSLYQSERRGPTQLIATDHRTSMIARTKRSVSLDWFKKSAE